MASKPLGIVCALPTEAKTLTRKTIAIGTILPLSEGVWLTVSGMGARRAQEAARLLLEQGAGSLLSWGTAGALDDTLRVGDLLLPQRILAMDGQEWSISSTWQELLYRKLATSITSHLGALAESNGVLRIPPQRRTLAASCGAIAVDMESVAIARYAHQNRAPFLTIRAVSDTTQMVLPESLLKAVNPLGKLSRQDVLTEVILKPQDWLRIANLAKGLYAAKRTLRQVLNSLGFKGLEVPTPE
jgi:adenosylhomocysteine nucleosidase